MPETLIRLDDVSFAYAGQSDTAARSTHADGAGGKAEQSGHIGGEARDTRADGAGGEAEQAGHIGGEARDTHADGAGEEAEQAGHTDTAARDTRADGAGAISGSGAGVADNPDAVINHISLDIPRGAFVAVLGRNGSGKSTLARLLNALYLPTSGKVIIGGLDTSDPDSIRLVRRKVGMIFQNPDDQIIGTQVREDVAFGPENLGIPTEEMIPRVDSVMAAVGISDLADAMPHLLSGGQKQRVAIAGVLAMEPDVLVADEATAMLDPAGRKDVIRTVRELNRARNITVIWITHFMEEAALADRVIVLHRGTVEADGTPEELFRNVDLLRGQHLDIPPVCDIAERLRTGGMPLPDNIFRPEDLAREVTRILCTSKSVT